MSTTADTSDRVVHKLREVLQKYWGYDSFLPLQEQAMTSVVDGRDSLVVLPTGGGKSLCFQAPALCLDGLAIVVSPLIALMKDQVDALRSNGVAAACIHSMISLSEKRQIADDIRDGRLKLLYVAPERLVQDRTIDFLKGQNVSLIAIDEAHCISAWGHDFRPEYRQMRMMRDAFPNVAIHAYTATATPQVRKDIVEQLSLSDAEVLVGSFDRSNLIYKVQRRNNRLKQIRDVLDRNAGQSGIVYCITRREVEETSAALSELGYRALPYHAGMTDEDRQANQDAFIREQTDVIVATIAFGMGIDKSNVRFVIHSGMPKSLEHYQQESGRAGRDGLDAECHLIYSGQDFITWRNILENGDTPPEAARGMLKALGAISNFCAGVTCRHRSLIEYFGQTYDRDNCGACDVCVGDLDLVVDPVIVAQKILSCVLRLNERFGAAYTTDVLCGSTVERIIEMRHDQLSTYGLLADDGKRAVRDWIEQLVEQGFAQKTGEYNVLQVTGKGRRLLKKDYDEQPPRLLKPSKPSKQKRSEGVAADSWEGVHKELFEVLRDLRRDLAIARGVPAYIIFGDASLRDMARRRPSTMASFQFVKGVGEKKLQDFGETFVDCIVKFCRQENVDMDVDVRVAAALPTPRVESDSGPSMAATRVFGLFRQGLSVNEIAKQIQRVPSTVHGYLIDYLQHEKVTDPSPWIESEVADRIATAASEVGCDRLKPIFDALGQAVDYDSIRIVVTCLKNTM